MLQGGRRCVHVNIKGWLLRVGWMRTIINGEGIEREKSGKVGASAELRVLYRRTCKSAVNAVA